MATMLEEQQREALWAEIELYMRIISWREKRRTILPNPKPDQIEARVRARLRIANAMWHAIDHSRYDIPF